MFKRAIIGLIAVLSCCSLVCVGFSSWYVNDGTGIGKNVGGSLSSENIIVSDDYVSVTVNTENFVVTQIGFESGKNYCDVSFEIKDAVSSFVGAADTLTIKLTVTFKNDIDTSLQKDALFRNIAFEVTNPGTTTSVRSDTTSTYAEFTFTVESASSLVGQNALQGKFTFKHTGDDYKNLYTALNVNNSGTIQNPFSLVVAVSNDQ